MSGAIETSASATVVTRYRLTAAPAFGPFDFAAIAVLFAILNGISPAWEAVR